MGCNVVLSGARWLFFILSVVLVRQNYGKWPLAQSPYLSQRLAARGPSAAVGVYMGCNVVLSGARWLFFILSVVLVRQTYRTAPLAHAPSYRNASQRQGRWPPCVSMVGYVVLCGFGRLIIILSVVLVRQNYGPPPLADGPPYERLVARSADAHAARYAPAIDPTFVFLSFWHV